MLETFKFKSRDGDMMELRIHFRSGKKRGWIAWVDGRRERGIGRTKAEARDDLLQYDAVCGSAQPVEYEPYEAPYAPAGSRFCTAF